MYCYKDGVIKEESEDVKTEEAFRVKHEDTEDQTKMAVIKEESEDFRIEEVFSLKVLRNKQVSFILKAKLTHLIHIQMYSSTDMKDIFVFICMS